MTHSPRILVTGSRDWENVGIILEVLSDLHSSMPTATLVHGACPTGADKAADAIWTTWGLPVERFPADWQTHGRAAGPIRNQQMVDTGAAICIAFNRNDSRGTADCVKRAKKAGIPVRIYNASL